MPEAGPFTGSLHWEWTQFVSKTNAWMLSLLQTSRLQSEFCLENGFCADFSFSDVLLAPSSVAQQY